MNDGGNIEVSKIVLNRFKNWLKLGFLPFAKKSCFTFLLKNYFFKKVKSNASQIFAAASRNSSGECTAETNPTS
jgi:hypothetical protein